MKSLVSICCLALCGCLAFAAENPVMLYPGMGSWHHPIQTSNSDAQEYFDQGLSLAYGFNRYAALQSFRKASQLDPAAAMPYWGMALAQGPYVNMDGDPSYDLKSACAAAHAGLKIKHAPPQERAYLEVAASWCPEYKPDTYVEAAHRLALAYPDDLDAQVIYADSLLVRTRWHWYSVNGKPAPGVEEAETVLQNVIRRWPQHPAANHLYIHAVESSPTPERGIPSAQRLMGIVPGGGHMVHMPGHIWLVMGDWEQAATVNDRAVAVDREYFKLSQVNAGSYEPYYVHNLHFVAYARSMQGHRKQAIEAAEQIQKESDAMASTMPEMVDYFQVVPLFVYDRFGVWDQILKIPEPSEKMAAANAIWSYSRTLALLATGDAAGAEQERTHFEQLRKAVPAGASLGENTLAGVLEVASEILTARATPDQSCTHWAHAVQLQDQFVYDEPPGWYYPVRESQGACLLQSGKPAEAALVFREGVRRSPRNGRMLFGLWQALEAQGDAYAAASVKREYAAAWAGSDVQLRIADF